MSTAFAAMAAACRCSARESGREQKAVGSCKTLSAERVCELAAAHLNLASQNAIVISGFPLPLRETDDDDGYRCRAPTFSSRGCRAFAPDGAFGLFRDRYLP